jgi:tRNA (guanine9-N1)-methyltransferase
MYSYAANGKAVVPTRLSLTGCTGEILGHLNKVSGFSNWLIHKNEVSYLEAFQERKQDMVYLTADSDCQIDQLEESKIYIIGGLVDRNRWKGLTLEKAKSQGIATAKLPISEHMKLTGSMVCMHMKFTGLIVCIHMKLTGSMICSYSYEKTLPTNRKELGKIF